MKFLLCEMRDGRRDIRGEKRKRSWMVAVPCASFSHLPGTNIHIKFVSQPWNLEPQLRADMLCPNPTDTQGLGLCLAACFRKMSANPCWYARLETHKLLGHLLFVICCWNTEITDMHI